MKPRTAEELAMFDRLGLDAERIYRYRAAYPEEDRRNQVLRQAWHEDAARGHPKLPDIGASKHIMAEDQFAYTTRGQCPGAKELEE